MIILGRNSPLNVLSRFTSQHATEQAAQRMRFGVKPSSALYKAKKLFLLWHIWTQMCAVFFPSLTGHALLGHLSVVDLLLQGEVTDEAVDVAGFPLTIAVHSTHRLGVVTRVPGRVEHHNAVGPDQIDPQAARSVWTKSTKNN